MRRRTRRRRRCASSLVAVAVLARRRRAHRRSPSSRPAAGARRRVDRPTPRRPPTPARRRHHGRRRRRRGRRRPPTPTDGPRRPASIDWQRVDDELEPGTLEVPVDYDDPDGGTFELFLVRRPADDQDEQDRHRCSSTPAGPAFGGRRLRRRRRAHLRRGAARALRHRRLGPARHRATPAGDRLHRRLRPVLRRHRHHARRRRRAPADRRPRRGLRRTQCVDEERRHPPARRHERLGPRHGLDPPGARRGRDLATSGSATAASSARRGRRCSPTPCAPRCSTAPPTRPSGSLEGGVAAGDGLRGHARHVPRRSAARDDDCAFHNDGDAEGAFDDADARRSTTSRSRASPAAPTSRAAWRCRPSARRCTTSSFWDQLSEALADAQDGDGEGLLALCDSYYHRNPDGTWPNSSRRSRRSRCMDDAERPTVEEDDASAPQFLDGRAALRAGHDGRRTSARSSRRPSRPADRRSPAPAPGRSSSSARPATRRRRWRARGRWPTRWRTAGSSSSTADQHTGYGVNDCGDDVDRRLPDRPRGPAGRDRLLAVRPSGPARSGRFRRTGRRSAWRKGWDSNPRRPEGPQRLSRPSHSSTLASFRGGRLSPRPR